MLRFSVLTCVLGMVSLFGACYSTNADPDDESGGTGNSGASSGGKGGTTLGGKGGATARGGATGDPPLGGAPGDGGETGSSGNTSGGTGGTGGTGGSTGCVTETRVLEDLVMAGAGGEAQIDFTICDFNVPADVDDNFINVFIGGSQLCWLGSSQGCDLTPNGWWLNGGQILLCDSACSSYFDPEPDIPVSIQIGCPSDSCL